MLERFPSLPDGTPISIKSFQQWFSRMVFIQGCCHKWRIVWRLFTSESTEVKESCWPPLCHYEYLFDAMMIWGCIILRKRYSDFNPLTKWSCPGFGHIQLERKEGFWDDVSQYCDYSIGGCPPAPFYDGKKIHISTHHWSQLMKARILLMHSHRQNV